MNISVIIPVYNAEKYLSKCLDSLMHESLDNIEVIIINDGSTDNSINIIREYEQKMKNVVVIDKIHEGQSRARNRAINLAKGEYVFYLDSDDWLIEDGLSKLYRAAKEKDADIANGLCYIVDEENNKQLDLEFPVDDVQRKFIVNEANHYAKIIKRDFIIKHSLYFLENHIYEEVATIPAYGMYTDKIIYEDIPLYNKLNRNDSVKTGITYNKKVEDIFYALKVLHMLFSNASKADEFNDELEYLFIEYLLHDASIRFYKFKEAHENLDKVIDMMNEYYPNWMNNKYYLQKDKKFRKLCKKFYKKNYLFLKVK